VDKLVDQLHDGPRAARVDRVIAVPTEAKGMDGFEIRAP